MRQLCSKMFKDTLFVDFLNLPKKHSETKLRNSLIEHMKQFILELGKDFIFMDQEYRLNIGASTFKADLLFFHRGLQALVAVELKKTKFHPRDLGQLEFYLEALDRDVKRSNENPSIGIILCPEADRVVVEYAMSRSMSPTMIAEYKRILIPQERMQQQLNEFCNLILKQRLAPMDTKKLRQKILDLAIHGKLVPQDPNDEPASVLLERIKAEKERLIKEGKIKRSKKTAKTSDTPHYENVPFGTSNGTFP